MIDIPTALATLAKNRPVFHSEADFQHSLAWEIQKKLPDASVRLERPMMHSGRNLHVDVWITQGAQLLALELKYKTRKVEWPLPNAEEKYYLRDHGAQDIGRYDFAKDIWRLEQLLKGRQGAVGYAILLTNDSSYWSRTKGAPVDADFRLDEGRMVQGALMWQQEAGIGTTRGRKTAIELYGQYTLAWDDYSLLEASRYNRFRYTAVKVEPGH